MSFPELADAELAEIDQRIAMRATDEVEKCLHEWTDFILDYDARTLAVLVSALYQRKDSAAEMADRIVREYKADRLANASQQEREDLEQELNEEGANVD